MKKFKIAIGIGVLVLAFAVYRGNMSKLQGQKKDTMQTSHNMEKDKMKDDKMNDKNAKTNSSKTQNENSIGNKMNEGNPAPDFTLSDIKGNSVKLSDLKGKKVYVKFWASWCPICLSGLEELNDLAKDNKDFEILTVVAPGIKGEKNKKDFIEWFNGLKYDNIKVLFDESGDSLEKYGVRAYPTSAVIGTDGILVGVRPGHLDKNTIQKVFQSVK